MDSVTAVARHSERMRRISCWARAKGNGATTERFFDCAQNDARGREGYGGYEDTKTRRMRVLHASLVFKLIRYTVVNRVWYRKPQWERFSFECC